MDEKITPPSGDAPPHEEDLEIEVSQEEEPAQEVEVEEEKATKPAAGPAKAPEQPKKPSRRDQRIDELTRRMREAERRAEEADRRAQALEARYNADSTAQQAARFDSQIANEEALAQKALRDAFEANDPDAVARANSQVASAAVKRANLNAWKAAQGNKQPQKPAEQQRPQASPKAIAWAQRNDWFGKDKRRTALAYGIDAELKEEGFVPDSDEYYQELDTRLGQVFPAQRPSPPVNGGSRSPSPVAGVSRAPSGGNKVTLTPGQMTTAKALGLTPQEYARALIAEQSQSA